MSILTIKQRVNLPYLAFLFILTDETGIFSMTASNPIFHLDLNSLLKTLDMVSFKYHIS